MLRLPSPARPGPRRHVAAARHARPAALPDFALATVYGGARIATHHATQTTQLALSPFMLLGALVAFAL